MSGAGPWVSDDEEHYVELRLTSPRFEIYAVCDCGDESKPWWSSTPPTLWALAHVGRPVRDEEVRP